MKILVTGATGYIGGRLIPKLLNKGFDIRVFVRDPKRLNGKNWVEKVEIVKGDLLNKNQISEAMKDIDVAFFLVHAMYAGDNYAKLEQKFAENFVRAAKNVKKVIYLGGLVPEGENVSEHLKSRANVGIILRENLPTTEFQAGPIIGSGSASFEMVRYLTERIPVMVTPKWVKNPVQPIAVRNVIEYLTEAVAKEPLGIVEIGANTLPFKEMMVGFAKVRGLKRIIIPLPVLSPLLSGLWVGLITPIPNTLAIPLIKGIINPVIADTKKAKRHFPNIKPINYEEAVKKALEKINKRATETRWSGSLGKSQTYKLTDKEGLIKEVRTVMTDASPEAVYKSFTSIGGENGWLAWNWAWKLRGWFDSLIGGPGLSRGRRHPTEVGIGEALDFWRVEDLKPNSFILLRAEMKVPGKAWLQFEAIPDEKKTKLIQTALYAPKGLIGLIYWYAMFPAHLFLFSKMAKNIARGAEVYEGNMDTTEMPSTV
jgi:uncharacterized protein YbjT (DUF2867 family)